MNKTTRNALLLAALGSRLCGDSYVTLLAKSLPGEPEASFQLDDGETAECVSSAGGNVGFEKDGVRLGVINASLDPQFREKFVLAGPATVYLWRLQNNTPAMATFRITPSSVDTNRVLSVSHSDGFVVGLQASADGLNWTTLSTFTNAPTGPTNLLFRVRLATP